MAALNKNETEKLSLAERAMYDAAARLKREADKTGENVIEFSRSEVEFMIKTLEAAEKGVNTVKQMKGYYPS